MLAVGLCTRPNLFTLELFYNSVGKFAQKPAVRLIVVLQVAGLGCYGMYKLAMGLIFTEQVLFCHTAAQPGMLWRFTGGLKRG